MLDSPMGRIALYRERVVAWKALFAVYSREWA